MQLPELVVSFLILKYFSVLHDVHASSSSPVMQSKQVEWHYSLQIFVEADERYPVGQDAMHSCNTEKYFNIKNETTNSGNCITDPLDCSNNSVGVIYSNSTKKCESTCPDTQSLNTATNICESCHSECLTCLSPSDRTKCLTCNTSTIYAHYTNNRCLRCKEDAYFLYYTSESPDIGLCVWNCTEGFYSD